ncbi:DUF397 domain-containing protein [Streptomyces sp. G5(2025)]|uniref:DUF397 domain-containing protein n=1 Tax=Streptomyces sp. G5(2025) TaxID=3406628 RepID=UPI003C1F072C
MLAPDLGNVIWRKSSYSGGGSSGGDCVEVACLPHTTAIRDSKHPGGPALAITATAWDGFITAIKSASPEDEQSGKP